MLFSSMIRSIHLYAQSLVVLLSLYSIPLMAQNEIPSKVQFGDFIQLSTSIGFELYETEQLNTYIIIPTDIFLAIPINRIISIGINFTPIYVSDSFQEKSNYFRTSAFVRLSEYSFKDRLIFSGDIIGSYGNFVIEVDEKLNKRNVYYAGIRFNVEYEIFSKFYLQAGFKFIRQLEKGDYGIETYPFVGISYRLPTRKQ